MVELKRSEQGQRLLATGSLSENQSKEVSLKEIITHRTGAQMLSTRAVRWVSYVSEMRMRKRT